jgi:DNA polymerase III epsilon subunit-like protein
MNICFIDFETTGIDIFKDSPIEIGCVLVSEEGEILKEFHSYIKPRNNRVFSASSKNIHGMNKELLENAKSQQDVLIEFFNNMGTDYRFSGWNINFDVSFFRSMCHYNNMMREYNKIHHRHIDVQSIVFYLKEKNLLPNELKSLYDLINYFNLKRNIKHNAMEDAELTFQVYQRLMSLTN